MREDALARERKTLDEENAKLKTAESEVKRRQDLLTEATRVRQTIEDAKNAALTQATAETSSAAQFMTPIQRKELSEKATEKIASSVESMVTKVLEKDYTIDACLNVLTREPRRELSSEEARTLTETRYLCIDLVEAQIRQRLQQLGVGLPESGARR